MSREQEKPDCPTASGFKRLFFCPKSWQLERKMPRETSAEAERGTRLHKAVELALLGKDNSELIYDDDERGAVQMCVDEFNKREWFAFDVEKRFTHSVGGVALFSGQTDVIAYAEDDMHDVDLFDWKFGMGHVDDAAGNLQMLAYVWLIVEGNWRMVKRVNVHIVQPFAIGKKITEAEFVSGVNYDHLETTAQIMAALLLANREDAPYAERPGEYCAFCRAKGICKAQERNAEIVASGGEIDKLNEAEITSENAVLTFEKIAEYEAKMNIVSKFLDAKKRLLEAYVLDSKDERFSWKDGRKIETYDVRKTFGAVSDIISENDFLDCVKLNKTALIDKIKSAGYSATEAKQALQDACEMAGAITTQHAKKTLILNKEK